MPAGSKPKVVVPHQPTPGARIAAWLISGLSRVMAVTVRFRFPPETEIDSVLARRPLIFCAWHNRLSLSLPVYNRLVRARRPDRRMAGLVSASRDGALLARILENFGAQPVRGSSSRRGSQALLELTTWAEKGYDLAITPDGPRGPRYRVQEGAIMLAQVTGAPIVPISYGLSWKTQSKSWDQFQIPIPFTVCQIELGPILSVPRECSPEEREQLRQELEKRLLAVTRD